MLHTGAQIFDLLIALPQLNNTFIGNMSIKEASSSFLCQHVAHLMLTQAAFVVISLVILISPSDSGVLHSEAVVLAA